ETFSGEHYGAWADAPETFRTGEPAFPRVYGAAYFDWLQAHPAEAERFNRSMSGSATMRQAVLLEEDWSGVETVVDVGGGVGTMLVAVLTANPHLRGIVFDVPQTRPAAEETIGAAGLGGRCTFAGGSFFDAVPAGADVYVLSQILHDWDDERAVEILRVCRHAARSDSRLRLVEAVLEPGDAWDWLKLLDLHMLVLLGGRERAEDEWRAVLEAGGFRLERVTTREAASVLEAAPA
ncbi:MAG TPA: methyltransferase, partial [Gaiellaceae bacterium]|nr:methyltransferase [Gaiellaceae bacterium]